MIITRKCHRNFGKWTTNYGTIYEETSSSVRNITKKIQVHSKTLTRQRTLLSFSLSSLCFTSWVKLSKASGKAIRPKHLKNRRNPFYIMARTVFITITSFLTTFHMCKKNMTHEATNVNVF